MATALGHAAVRRRYSVAFYRADVLLKRLRASRLDNSHDSEIRNSYGWTCSYSMTSRPFDTLDTADIYELIIERHRVVHRGDLKPGADRAAGPDGRTLLAQSAIDRLRSAAYKLALHGESYRRHHHITNADGHPDPVPCRWRKGDPLLVAAYNDTHYNAGCSGSIAHISIGRSVPARNTVPTDRQESHHDRAGSPTLPSL
jgi:hypothetical protein